MGRIALRTGIALLALSVAMLVVLLVWLSMWLRRRWRSHAYAPFLTYDPECLWPTPLPADAGRWTYGEVSTEDVDRAVDAFGGSIHGTCSPLSTEVGKYVERATDLLSKPVYGARYGVGASRVDASRVNKKRNMKKKTPARGGGINKWAQNLLGLLRPKRLEETSKRELSSVPSYYHNFCQNMYPPTFDDNRVNQQMALLLMRQDQGTTPDAHSATFRIDLPEDMVERERPANAQPQIKNALQAPELDNGGPDQNPTGQDYTMINAQHPTPIPLASVSSHDSGSIGTHRRPSLSSSHAPYDERGRVHRRYLVERGYIDPSDLTGGQGNDDEEEGEWESTQSEYPRLVGSWTPQDMYPEVADLFKQPNQDNTSSPSIPGLNFPSNFKVASRKPKPKHLELETARPINLEELRLLSPEQIRLQISIQECQHHSASSSVGDKSCSVYEGVLPEKRSSTEGEEKDLLLEEMMEGLAGGDKNEERDDGERNNAFQLDTSGSLSIDPWAVEFGPNPVIFSHLREDQPGMAVVNTWNNVIGTPLDDICMKDFLTTQPEFGIPRRFPVREHTRTISSVSGEDGCTRVLPEVVSSVKSASTSESACDSHPSTPMSSVASVSENTQVSETPKPFASSDPAARYEAGEGNGCSEQRTCANCPAVFSSENAFSEHIQRRRCRRHTCESCPARFALKADLNRHLRTVHRATRNRWKAFICSNPKCSVPNKQFLRKDNFERHVRRCVEEAPAG